jgi:hypothetical protein
VFPGIAGYDCYTDRYQLVAEVLSPTNTKREMGLKLRRYREAPECLYAVVANSRVIGLRCSVGELYRGTPLDPSRG